METNTLWDGLFHATTYVATVAALVLLWRETRNPVYKPLSMAFLVGLLLIGWGAFNLVEGTINHHILTIHHVREDSSNKGLWDLAFLIWGALMLVGGLTLARTENRRLDQARPRR